MVIEGDLTAMRPNEARLRNLSYSAPLYIDITKNVHKDGKKQVETTLENIHRKNPNYVEIQILPAEWIE